MSVDYRQAIVPLNAQIEQVRKALATQSANVAIWQENVANAVVYKTKHQGTLSKEQIKETMLAGELAHLESQVVPPAQIIYERAAPYFGTDASVLQLIIRLAWATALTLSPIILVLLIAVEFGLVGVPPKDSPVSDTPNPTPTERKQRKSFTDMFHALEGSKSSFSKSPIHASALVDPCNTDTVTVPDVIQPKKRSSERKDHIKQGLQRDTGTVGKAGNRYEDVKSAVLRGTVKPSVRKIREYSSCSQPIAQRYISQLADEGIIEQAGQGWKVKGIRAVNS
jgi:hypothetical protein